MAASRAFTIDPGRWVDEHGDVLFRFALVRVRDSHVAEELVQETFCAALQSLDSFSGRSSERTWLVGILKHKIADHFRRMGREQLADAREFEDAITEEFFDEKGRWKIHPGTWGESPEKALERQEFWAVFQQCLERLPERLRQAFAFRELDEMDSEEICKFLKITSTNLWVILHRARNQLRRCLEIHWFRSTGGSRPS